MIPLGRAASVDFRGDAADLSMAFEAVIEAIAKVVDVSDVTGDKLDMRVRVGAGGCVRLLGGVPADPKASPEGTLALTMVLEATDGLSSDQVRALLGAVRRVPFTECEMATLRSQMPLTGELPMFAPAGCLSSVAPVLTVHHMRDFLILVEAVREMGVPPQAITVLDKGYPYQYTDRVDTHLTRQGITVWPWTRTPDALEDHVRRAAQLGRRGLLVDDGGYTLPVLLQRRPDLLPHFTALVEQTISGITRLERWPQLPLPIFSVAESRMKATIESYGVADAAIRNTLRLLSEEKLEGQAALVVGYGRIGQQIAEVLQSRRMRVAVHDQQLVQLIAAQERGFVTGRCLSTLLREHQPMLIVGGTGRTCLRGEHAAAIRGDCYVVSTTSRDKEFAIGELAAEAVSVSDAGVLGLRLHLRSGACVTLVADGYPVNFHRSESLPNRYSDLILASLLVGAATLAAPDHGFAAGHNVARSDQVLESCGLLERYYDRFGPKAAR